MSGEQPDRVTPEDGPAAPPGWDGILSEIGVTLTPLPDGEGRGIRIFVGRCV